MNTDQKTSSNQSRGNFPGSLFFTELQKIARSTTVKIEDIDHQLNQSSDISSLNIPSDWQELHQQLQSITDSCDQIKHSLTNELSDKLLSNAIPQFYQMCHWLYLEKERISHQLQQYGYQLPSDFANMNGNVIYQQNMNIAYTEKQALKMKEELLKIEQNLSQTIDNNMDTDSDSDNMVMDDELKTNDTKNAIFNSPKLKKRKNNENEITFDFNSNSFLKQNEKKIEKNMMNNSNISNYSNSMSAPMSTPPNLKHLSSTFEQNDEDFLLTPPMLKNYKNRSENRSPSKTEMDIDNYENICENVDKYLMSSSSTLIPMTVSSISAMQQRNESVIKRKNIKIMDESELNETPSWLKTQLGGLQMVNKNIRIINHVLQSESCNGSITKSEFTDLIDKEKPFLLMLTRSNRMKAEWCNGDNVYSVL